MRRSRISRRSRRTKIKKRTKRSRRSRNMRRSRNKRRSRGLRERTQRGGMKKFFGKSKELDFHPTKVHKDGTTDLHRLCYATDPQHNIYYPGIQLERRLEIIQLLISTGADVNKMAGKMVGNKKTGRKMTRKKTPLHYSCGSHHEADGEISKLLIEAGADVNAGHGDGGETPLHSCLKCKHHKPKTVRMLLDAGAVVTKRRLDDGIQTPLQYACEEQDWNQKPASVEIVKMLLPEYAKVGIRDIIKYLDFYHVYGNGVLDSPLYSPEIRVLLQEYNTEQERLAAELEVSPFNDALSEAMGGLDTELLAKIGGQVGISGGAPGGGATG